MQKTLQISKNILPKIPQFWSSAHSAFAELVQNAFRGGAMTIRIEVDPESGTLEIRDNGRGIRSLEDFLTVGSSDWEKTIVEPAGMGFYAHLGYAGKTTVLSRGRQYTFTPACLEGAPVDIQDVPGDEWTVVEARGIEPGVLRGLDFRRMRPLPDPAADIRYRVNGEEVPNPLAGLTSLITPVGWVYLTRVDSPDRFPVGIWEGLPVGFSDAPFRSNYGEERVWAADPACGARPQLPGREHFIRDEAYKVAQAEIDQAVEAYCRRRAATLPLDRLPATFDYRSPLAAALAPFGIHEKAIVSWVKKHHYRSIGVFEGSWERDGYDSPEYPVTTSHPVRADLVVPFSLGEASEPWEAEAVETLLNSQTSGWETWLEPSEAHPARPAYLYAADGPPLALAGLRQIGEAWATEAVTIGGRVVLEGPAVCLHGGKPVWIGAPETVLDHARALADFWHYAVYSAEEDTWYDWIGADREFDDDELERSLAAWYGLGEAVNLQNWLKRTELSLTGWNGPPGSTVPIFRAGLRTAAWLARRRLRIERWKQRLWRNRPLTNVPEHTQSE